WILHELPIVYRTVTSVETAEKEAMLSDHPIMVVYTRSSHTTPLLKAMIYKFSHAVNFLVVNSDQLLPRRNDIVAKLYYDGREVSTRQLSTKTIEETLSEMLREVPLEINQLNVKQLCRPSKSVSDSMKVYCVLMSPSVRKDVADELVTSLRRQKTTFHKFDPSDVDIDIQLGWVGEECAEKYGDSIVLEYETQRYATLKDPETRIPQLFTDLALGDILFNPLEAHIGECLEDPRRSRLDAVVKLVATKEGMLTLFCLAVGGGAAVYFLGTTGIVFLLLGSGLIIGIATSDIWQKLMAFFKF
ncbi:hypothetical protein Pmar_PMAR024655, partial [Perkinsus marinus ATCC 50983]